MTSQQLDLQYTTLTTPLPDFIFKNLRSYSKRANSYHSQPKELKERLAKKFEISEDMLFLTAGADEAIEMFAIAYGQGTYVFTPAYIFYHDIQELGAHVTFINAYKEDSFVIEIEKKKDATLFFIANPNNPFGYTPREKIVELIEHNPQAIVVLDEVYAEFIKDSMIDLTQRYTNVAVLRSFSKSYGMAGNRVGCIISNPELIKKIQWKTQWANVSYLSVGAALTALDHEEYFQTLREGIVKRRASFEDFLAKKGFHTLPSYINSVTIKFDTEEKGIIFNKYLNDNNVLVNFGNGTSMVGVDKSFVRIAIGTEEEMAQLQEIISRFQ